MDSKCSHCGEQHEDCECVVGMDICCGSYHEEYCCIPDLNNPKTEEE